MPEPQYKRVTREEAFSRDPFDTTPIEYEDEIVTTYQNLETGECKRVVTKGLARINARPSAAIIAYYERLRRQQDSDRRDSA